MASTRVSASTTRSTVQDGGARPRRSGTIGVSVYAHLRTALMLGEYAPGEKIVVSSVAKALGVSPMPVRQALSRLVVAGGLEMSPNRSVRVPNLSAREIMQTRQLRMMLEAEAASVAAQVMDAATLARLEALQVGIAAARARHRAADVLRLNSEFHLLINAAAQNPVLLDLIGTLWLRSGPSMRLIPEAALGPVLYAEPDPHIALLSALRKRDLTAARAAILADFAPANDVFRERARAGH